MNVVVVQYKYKCVVYYQRRSIHFGGNGRGTNKNRFTFNANDDDDVF